MSSTGAVRPWEATAVSARIKSRGNAFPRRAARRRIPAHASELKKNRSGIEPLTSTCHNEHTTAPLCQSEILGIKGPPCDCPFGSSSATCVRPLRAMLTGFLIPCPEGSGPCRFRSWPRLKSVVIASESCEETPKGIVGMIEDSWDIFPNNDKGGLAVCKPDFVNGIRKIDEGDRQLPTTVGQTASHSSHGERLTWGPADQDIRCRDFARAHLCGKSSHVSVIGHIREPVIQKFTCSLVDFSEPISLPTERLPCNRGCFNSRTN